MGTLGPKYLICGYLDPLEKLCWKLTSSCMTFYTKNIEQHWNSGSIVVNIGSCMTSIINNMLSMACTVLALISDGLHVSYGQNSLHTGLHGQGWYSTASQVHLTGAGKIDRVAQCSARSGYSRSQKVGIRPSSNPKA